MASVTSTKRNKRRRGFRSALTLRILALNVIAPLVLLVGVLYTGEYRENLIGADLETIKAHAQLFAGAIAESAIRQADDAPVQLFAHNEPPDVLSPTISRRIIRRLTENTDNRARVFDAGGKEVGDSAQMNRPVKTVAPAASPATQKVANVLRYVMHSVLALFPTKSRLHPYSTIDSMDIKDHPDADAALHGRTAATAWAGDDRGDVILSAAMPIRKGKQVMGVVLLTREADDVEDAMVQVRFEVVTAFFVALSVTVLLSFYLASTIGRPLRRLAIAAETIRRSKTRQADIPDLSRRRDEIGELSLALRDMTQALWDRMDSIEHFAADVAHEIKNPLTSLRSAVETVSRVKSAADRDRLIEIINHDVQRLDRLISDISNASRLDAELSRDEMMGAVDLRRLLLQLADLHRDPLTRAAAEDAASAVIVAGPPLSAMVRGNEGRLGQVFENLITNALSFSPPGRPVVVGIHVAGKEIAVTIDDEGAGIPDGKLEAIFDRFYTERPEHESYGRHSGLGLSIARQIVQAHGGRIYAENRMDGTGVAASGARFVVVLEAV